MAWGRGIEFHDRLFSLVQGRAGFLNRDRSNTTRHDPMPDDDHVESLRPPPPMPSPYGSAPRPAATRRAGPSNVAGPRDWDLATAADGPSSLFRRISSARALPLCSWLNGVQWKWERSQ